MRGLNVSVAAGLLIYYIRGLEGGEIMEKEVEVVAVHDKVTKRYDRYYIKPNKGVGGCVYVPIDAVVPKRVVVGLRRTKPKE